MEQKEIRLIHKAEEAFLPFFIQKDATPPEREGVTVQSHRALLLCELQKAAEQIEASEKQHQAIVKQRNAVKQQLAALDEQSAAWEKQRMMLNEHYVWLEHRYAQLMRQ